MANRPRRWLIQPVWHTIFNKTIVEHRRAIQSHTSNANYRHSGREWHPHYSIHWNSYTGPGHARHNDEDDQTRGISSTEHSGNEEKSGQDNDLQDAKYHTDKKESTEVGHA